MQRTSVAVIFDKIGPYHHARLRAAARHGDVFAIEICSETGLYNWAKVDASSFHKGAMLFEERRVGRIKSRRLRRSLCECLASVRPGTVAVPGWTDKGALFAMDWCQRNATPVIMMSESTALDGPRRAWKEAIKKRLLVIAASALAGGTLHTSYLRMLGVPDEAIVIGYDVVDNEHFLKGADAVREDPELARAGKGLPQKFFLAVSRFVPEKNLGGLLQSYAKYRSLAGTDPWDLVILGDGMLRPDLERRCRMLGISGHVLMPGFKQYDELPVYYGLAGALVHASVIEPWGLVVNEAMASGMPVLVSNRCGCAADLVMDGVNGFTFDPANHDGLAALMVKISCAVGDTAKMARAGREIVSKWTPEVFARGMWRAFEIAASRARISGVPLTSRLALECMILAGGRHFWR